MGWQDAPIVGDANANNRPKWMDATVAGEAQATPSVRGSASTNGVGAQASASSETDALVPVAKYEDGTIYRDASGKLLFKSPGYATVDQAVIAEMMRGVSPAETGQSQIDMQRIGENPIAARAQKVVEGVPFVGSWADEAVGMVSPEAQANMRATSAAMDRQYPKTSMALGLAGSIAGSIPIAAAVAPAAMSNPATTIGGRAVTGLATGFTAGGVEGAVYGAGREGDRIGNAVRGGAIGAAVGGVLGAAAPYVAEGIKRVFMSVKDAPEVVIAKQLGVSPPAAKVIKAALDAGDIDEAIRAFDRAGGNAMLADAGQPARQLLDAAANTGGAAGRIVKDAVEDRATQGGKAVVSALDDALGPPKGISSIGKAVRTGTAAARDLSYEAAYSAPIDYSGTRGRKLEELMARVPKAAIAKANELMRVNGEESAQIMLREVQPGKFSVEKMPDVRQWDYITRALQDVAAETDGAGKLGGKTQLGGAYANLSSQIRSLLKAEVPEYATALQTASDAISRVKASEIGYTLLRPNVTRETVAEALRGGMPKEEMKAGIRAYIDDTMATVKRTMSDPNIDAREAVKAIKDISSRANETKLRMVLGGDGYKKLAKAIDQAATAFELRAALETNSKTAIRQSIQGQVTAQTAPSLAEAVATGRPIETARKFVEVFTGSTAEAQALREAGIYEEIARVLTETKGYQAKVALRLVQKAIAGQKLSAPQAEAIGRSVATALALTGSHTTSRSLSTR